MPRLAVRVSRDPPLLPVGDGGGNGRIGGGVGAGLGVRHCPNIGTILVGGGAARVLKVTGEWGQALWRLGGGGGAPGGHKIHKRLQCTISTEGMFRMTMITISLMHDFHV